MDNELDKIWARKRLETVENLYLPTGDLIVILFGALLLLGGLYLAGTLANPFRTRESIEVTAAKNSSYPTFEERWPSISRG
jgi:hypothetical protein